jgi:hypothetical protein
MKILMFFINGEPKSSVIIMVIKERKPRPMNSADPQGRGLGAKIVGQRANMPVVGLVAQLLLPPPQSRMPEDPIREAPIIKTTVPVTMGGNIRCKMRGGIKDMKISRKEHIMDVPSTIPYASGQEPRVPSEFVGHVPLLYMASKIALAVLKVAKLVPTTLISPVPSL